MENQINLLFLCTGNSCRSQIAEGYGKLFGQQNIRVESAGIETHGININAVYTMAEDGVNIAAQHSLKVTEAMLEASDIVVTVCGHADEHCPAVSNKHKIHWPLPDPAKIEGTEEEVMEFFREVRDDIKLRVQGLIENIRLGQYMMN